MVIDHAALVAYAAEHNKRATFDGRIADLEHICRRDLPAPDASPAEDSRPWFAREILLVISAVRHALTRGDWENAASEAVVVGALAATAEARHNWPELKRWNAHLAKQRERSIAGVITKRDATARSDEKLLVAVRALRARHPGMSRRAIAQRLRPAGVSLDAMAKRLTRLETRRK